MLRATVATSMAVIVTVMATVGVHTRKRIMRRRKIIAALKRVMRR